MPIEHFVREVRVDDLRAANEGPVRLVNKMEMRNGKNGRRFNQGRLLGHEAIQLPSVGKNKARRIGKTGNPEWGRRGG